MNLKKLRDEIKKLKKNRIDKCNCEICYNSDNKLEGIKQTVEAVDIIVDRRIDTNGLKLWQEIKKLLNLKTGGR